jgi:pimeloyl-ACP methyl ester carboxylesterase
MRPQPPRRSTHITHSPLTRLVFDRWGDYGRPVLLLHGLAFDRTIWWPAAADLVMITSCTVIAVDLPGHGQSPPRDDYRPQRLARDLATLIDGLGLRRAPIVVGHGASSRLAAAFGQDYATHHLVTVDEPPAAARTLHDLVTTAGLDDVPPIYRPYAEPRTDVALLPAYESWLDQPPAHRNQPALTGGPRRRELSDKPFAQLTDPQAFAAQLRDLL